uniref:Uncharacterized protein n=1 Tax=Arundo donax TaxID=35708 RepID=A0A0A9EEB0_ARUDO
MQAQFSGPEYLTRHSTRGHRSVSEQSTATAIRRQSEFQRDMDKQKLPPAS